MAFLSFSWGTVRSTAHGAMLKLTRGSRFDLPISDAESVSEFIENITIAVPFVLAHIGMGAGPNIQLEWSINQKKIRKSVLYIGLGDDNGNPGSYGSPLGGRWAPGTTLTILSYSEAMELADALRAATKSVQLATVTP